jgi:tripartite-type tricarboxylate transporter receptor subunit TctC
MKPTVLPAARKPADLATWLKAAAACVCILGSQAALAEYPDRALKLVVPFAPGGAVDGAARPAAIELGRALGQSVVVDNRPGSGGVVGIQAVQRAAPDGYTLLLGNIALASAPALYPKSGVDPGDFAAVALIGTTPYVLVVRADAPFKSVADLVGKARGEPGRMNYSSAGAGSAIHLASELFKNKSGIDVLHVPYKGAAPAMTAVLAGEVQFTFSSLMEARPMIESGKVRALGVSSKQRSAAFPQVPTMTESGIAGYEVTGWYGIYAPAKTAPEVLRRLHAAAAAGLRSDAMKLALTRYGLEPATGDAAEARDMLQAEQRRWAEVVKSANIQSD